VRKTLLFALLIAGAAAVAALWLPTTPTNGVIRPGWGGVLAAAGLYLVLLAGWW